MSEDLGWLGDLPTGSRLAPDRQGNIAGTLGTHDSAEPARLKMARKYFREASAADFTRHGRKWVDQDGNEYRRCGWDPLAADVGNRDHDDLVFFISAGRLTYLRPRGAQRVQTSEVGQLTSGEVSRTGILSKAGPMIF